MNYVFQPNGIQHPVHFLPGPQPVQLHQPGYMQYQHPGQQPTQPPINPHLVVQGPQQPVILRGPNVQFNQDLNGTILPEKHTPVPAQGLFIAKAELDPLIMQIKNLLTQIESLPKKS